MLYEITEREYEIILAGLAELQYKFSAPVVIALEKQRLREETHNASVGETGNTGDRNGNTTGNS